MTTASITLDEAVDVARTGDVWLFRGHTVADRAIQVATNSPVNHVGMSVVIEDLPPLMWHAELGRSLPDVWTGARHRGVQLHDLREASCAVEGNGVPSFRSSGRPQAPGTDPETAYCAQVLAATYQAMGLLPDGRRPGWYDPGSFWSGDSLGLAAGFRLGGEIAVAILPLPRSRA